MSYVNVASIRMCTESEGPGKRLALWVQGCLRRCPGCCNPDMQEIKSNKIVAAEDIINVIRKSREENQIEGVSFIGGEPFLQAKGLSEIAEWVHGEEMSVLVFTGYLLEELRDMKNSDVDNLLKYTDILVDGPFIQEQYDMERDWIGSKNQKIYFVTDFYQQGIEFEKKEHQMEMLISSEDIIVNGWPYILY